MVKTGIFCQTKKNYRKEQFRAPIVRSTDKIEERPVLALHRNLTTPRSVKNSAGLKHRPRVIVLPTLSQP